jgi:hypothetical protein
VRTHLRVFEDSGRYFQVQTVSGSFRSLAPPLFAGTAQRETSC